MSDGQVDDAADCSLVGELWHQGYPLVTEESEGVGVDESRFECFEITVHGLGYRGLEHYSSEQGSAHVAIGESAHHSAIAVNDEKCHGLSGEVVEFSQGGF